MTPRLELFAINAVIAFALATLAYLCLFHGGAVSMWGRGFVLALTFSLPSVVAAVLGSWFGTASHARARAARRDITWSPGRLCLYVMLGILAMYPLAMGLSLGIVELASNSSSLSDASYVMGIGMVLGFLATIAGAVPAFILEYFVCRRYLRRTAVTTGSA